MSSYPGPWTWDYVNKEKWDGEVYIYDAADKIIAVVQDEQTAKRIIRIMNAEWRRGR